MLEDSSVLHSLVGMHPEAQISLINKEQHILHFVHPAFTGDNKFLRHYAIILITQNGL
jgi:hypothetical protein